MAHWASTIFILFFSLSSFGGVVELFICDGAKAVRFHPDYDARVKQIKPGDQINLCDGNGPTTINEELGRGHRAIIFSLTNEPEVALRVPLRKEYSSSMRGTVEGYERLEEFDVPRIKLYQNQKNFWAKVEAMPKDDLKAFTYMDRDYVDGKHDIILKKFRVFVLKTAMFLHIGDFHEVNFAYSHVKKDWLVVDWSNAHHLYQASKPSYNHPILTFSVHHPTLRNAYLEYANEVLKIRTAYENEVKNKPIGFREFLKPYIEKAECEVGLSEIL